jgi:putative flavoprotein involved in K+ transport
VKARHTSCSTDQSGNTYTEGESQMVTTIEKLKWDTVVIGAGQAGLATGYYLARAHDDFVIIDKEATAGDSWRQRWDSLKLFTPSQYACLPGLPFPGKRDIFPTKDEMADYLQSYAQQFALPVRLNVKVHELLKVPGGFEIVTSAGKMHARHVIIATGSSPNPNIPDFTKDIDKNIFQIHSSQYKNPQSVPSGNSLFVGAGNSGVEIALELSQSRKTFISGHPTPHIPDLVFRYARGLYWWFAYNILTTSTPIGRIVRSKVIKSGAPLLHVSFKDVKTAGILHLPRVSGVKKDRPQLPDGRTISVSSIVWATGFKPDFSWIRMNVTDDTGWPKTNRGVSVDVEGLFFVGMPFQFALTSGLVGGVRRDAAFVVRSLHLD